MRRRLIIYALLFACVDAWARDPRSSAQPPEAFEIGRHTFFDFGPPFDFYEIFLVRPTANGASVERITLIPPGDSCTPQSKIETASASVSSSIADLLGTKNPCAIPQKALSREQKRCKKCLVFSGADVAMRVQCGGESRIIQSKILDKDMFDPTVKTPAYTSWTMQLVERLDRAVGPGVMDRPIFPLLGKEGSSTNVPGSADLQDVGAGKYDALFQKTPNKPSDLYRSAQAPVSGPSVELINSSPFRPDAFIPPDYPPIARQARVQGEVTVTMNIDRDGKPIDCAVESGHPLLRGVVEKAASNWQFPKDAANQKIRATIGFKLNCPAQR